MSGHGPSGAASQTPERVGRYEILLPIASGGMATVYLARARGVGGFEQQVALKLTHAHLRDSTDFITDVLEEAKLAARIRHRNVISIVDVGDDPHGVFLVMEYVEGDTVASLRRRSNAANEPLPVSIASRILVDALNGLHAAHELVDDDGHPLGVVHRDVSPQNLIVGLDGVVRLTDFGIAKATSRLGQTRSGLVKGKISYMSPEQAKGKPIDRRCDVWAAGVVAWEMFTGKRIYGDLEDVAIVLKLVTEPPPRLRDMIPGIAPGIDEAVARALTMEADQRTPTAQVFSRELSNACRATGQLAEQDEVAELVGKLFGAKLADRRKRVAQITNLKTKVGQLAQGVEPSAPTPSGHQLRPPLPAMGEATVTIPSAPARPSDRMEISQISQISEISALQEVPETPPPMPAVITPPPVSSARLLPPPDPPVRTDTTSVSASLPPVSEPPKPKPKQTGIGVMIAVVVVPFLVAGLVAGVFVYRARTTREPENLLAATTPVPPVFTAPAPTASAAVVASTASSAPSSSPSPVPEPIELSDSVPPGTPAVVNVHANAAVTTLKINGRSIPIDKPQRDVVVTLEGDEKGGAKVEAATADGRVAYGMITGGAVTLHFEPGPTGRGAARPAKSANPNAPPPLAQSPYTDGGR